MTHRCTDFYVDTHRGVHVRIEGHLVEQFEEVEVCRVIEDFLAFFRRRKRPPKSNPFYLVDLKEEEMGTFKAKITLGEPTAADVIYQEVKAFVDGVELTTVQRQIKPTTAPALVEIGGFPEDSLCRIEVCDVDDANPPNKSTPPASTEFTPHDTTAPPQSNAFTVELEEEAAP